MEQKSRTEYSVRNTSAALISKIIAILIGFLTRIVFTHTLNESYVGINGLFSDILNVLALSELGVGTAITYALYEPIANQDHEKQKSLMRLYAGFYKLVALIVLVSGLCIIPFMDILIKNQPQVDHLLIIYLLYLTNSVLSYLLIYKRTLIDAHQLSYISEIYFTVFLVIQDIFQILILVTTHNFILFLVIYLLCTLGNNLSLSRKADRMYPYLSEKNVQPLPQEEKKTIIQNIKAMLMHKIGDVIINNTDNLLLSSLIGIVSVGCYSNYYLVIGSVHQVMTQIFKGITASVGNLGVSADEKRIRRVFEISFFIGQWMYALAAICLFELLNPFVKISFGDQYLFPIPVVLMLCVNFYITGMRQATLVFRDSLGIFWFDRYKSIACAILNLVFSIALARQFGTIGVFAGTFLSTMTTSFWVEPWMLYKYSLHHSPKIYFIKYGVYAAVTCLAAGITHFLCQHLIHGKSVILLLIGRFALCMLIPNLIFLICFCRMKEFSQIIEKLTFLLEKKRRKQSEFTREETFFLDSLAHELSDPASTGSLPIPSDIRWDRYRSLVLNHATAGFLYEQAGNRALPKELSGTIVQKSREVVRQNFRLLFLTHFVTEELKKIGIETVVLKGISTAWEYRVPELRKSGDVDLLLMNPEQIDRAQNCLCEWGMRAEEVQHSLHHRVLRTNDGIDIELHTCLIEPLDDESVNEFHKEIVCRIHEFVQKKEILGFSFFVLQEPYHAYYLLLHMLQHFLRSGFGVRLLCDWTVFWNQERENHSIREYHSLLKKSGLTGFSDMITSLCENFLGLKKESADKIRIHPIAEQDLSYFMKEILTSDEFGRQDVTRMVVMRDPHPISYLREFHHQMKLNHPDQSKHKWMWPVLWVSTFYQFCQNNYRLRKVSGWKILKKAGQRSRRIKSLKLFEKTQ